MAGGPDTGKSRSSRRGVRTPSGDAHVGEEIAGLRAASEAVIYRHIFGSADREVGGILVGRIAIDGGLPLVTGAIPAISADEQRATLTFTQEAWAHVHRTLEREFPPDEQIVGWYHSHPGFGVFLSGHDLFIHKHFFSAPSQIAVVVDPQTQREGVFTWRGPQITTLFERATPSDWIARPSVGKPGVHGERGPLDQRLADPARESYPLAALVIAAIVGVAIGFGFWSLAEGAGGKQASQAGGTTSVKTHRAKPAPAVENHIEVLAE
jgi:proteasome lid subunit RPN8/RPN11